MPAVSKDGPKTSETNLTSEGSSASMTTDARPLAEPGPKAVRRTGSVQGVKAQRLAAAAAAREAAAALRQQQRLTARPAVDGDVSDDDEDDFLGYDPSTTVIAQGTPRAQSLAEVRPTAGRAKVRPRHRRLLASFVLLVIVPIALCGWYLWDRAADQYASTVGFSVRREEVNSTMDLLGGLAGMSSSSSSDTDILYEFLQSQKLVADMQAALDLRKIWSRPENDPIFRFHPEGSIEDLVAYWARMVRISYDGSSGLIEVRALAFDPAEANAIAEALFRESSEMINDLSAIAREDAIRYSREELATAQIRLKAAREAVTSFRAKNQLVDPATDIQSQAGLLGSLQNQLAEAQIELDLLASSTPETDPRSLQAKRRIAVIEARIAAERRKVGLGSAESKGDDYAALVGEYESLAVDREFAEKSYVAALASYDAALAEARRKSRYLAAHVLPTTAEVSRYPERLTLLGLVSLFSILIWAIGSLIVYSLKDRR